MSEPESYEDLYTLDTTCPWCKADGVDGECFDGESRSCFSCGERVIIVAYTDRTMGLVKDERHPWRRTAKQRSADRKRRRGYR